jgi:hypothetical protein
MTRTQTATTTAATDETRTAEIPAARTRRGRGRRRVGRWVRPVYPIRALYDAASEEQRRRAHELSAMILEYWTGVKTKQEAAKALSVPPIRVWQMSQRAATGLVCALLTPPSGKRGAPMAASEEEKALRKEIERLRKENALQRELIEVLRELPGNRDREIRAVTPEGAAREAEAPKPRKRKSRGPRALPGDPGVVSPPSS